MIFKTQDLRDLLTARRKALADSDAQAHRREVEVHEKMLADWRRDKAPKLVTELRALANKAAKGQPVTRHDLDKIRPSYGSSPSLTFNGSPQPPKAPSAPRLSGDLEALSAVLDLITDETVSTSALRDFGIRNLRGLA